MSTKPRPRKRRRKTGIKDMSHFKPKKFQHYYTLSEVAALVKRHKSRIMTLEAEGKIPEAYRVQCGEISVRLWSPEQVDEIKWLLRTTIKPGRPPNAY